MSAMKTQNSLTTWPFWHGYESVRSRCRAAGFAIEQMQRAGVLYVSLLAAHSGFGGTIYVDCDAPGANDGSSWPNAYTSLHAALGVAVGGAEIWVAEGIYKPGSARTDAFQLRAAVSLFGGFAGTETFRSQRNWTNNIVVLSGDVGTPGNPSDNAYHVLKGVSGAVLDGFTITGGRGGTNWPSVSGAGLLNSNASPVIANCRFIENAASLTAGNGGAIFNLNSSPTISNCLFSGNSAYWGGAICNLNCGTVTVLDCEFVCNVADIGGAVNNESSNVSFRNCMFIGNTGDGGGMNNRGCAPSIINCVFAQNSAGLWQAGGMRNVAASPVVMNALFVENYTQEGDGAAVYSFKGAPQYINCTFYGNRAELGSGGAIFSDSVTEAAIRNSILWNNSAGAEGGEIYNASGTFAVSFCDIQEGVNGRKCGGVASMNSGGNLVSAPFFVNAADLKGPDNQFATADDGLQLNALLSATSPCINSAKPSGSPGFDLAGLFRPQENRFDMGAYEYNPDYDGDGLHNLLEYRNGYNPHSAHSDDDGVNDGLEYNVNGTNPLNSDTDGDGASDSLEILYGLNPIVDDAALDLDLDGVANGEEVRLGLDPGKACSFGDGVDDYRRVKGKEYVNYTYDRIDRLVGVEYSRGSNGLSIAYAYDGNGNIMRQIYLQRDQNGNGLPDVWEYLNGLLYTNSSVTGGTDADGDRWTNYQEWKAGSNPNDASSVPDLAGVTGVTGAVFQASFAVSNFVMAVGQLDGVGSEEIVIGADGNPHGGSNKISVLSREGYGWRIEYVDVGPYGVTSATVAQPTDTTQAAIYLGLRNFDSTGVVMRVACENGVWTCGMVAWNNSAPSNCMVNVGYVQDSHKVPNLLLARLDWTGQAAQSLFKLGSQSNGWTTTLIHTNAPARDGEAVPLFSLPTGNGGSQVRLARLTDDGDGELVNVGTPAMPAGAIYNAEYGAWYVLSPASSWTAAQAYSRTLGGHLVTIENSTKNQWILDNIRSKAAGDCWIGAKRASSGSTVWVWDRGDPFVYANWAPNEPNNPTTELCAHMYISGVWNDISEASSYQGIVEVRTGGKQLYLTNFVTDADAVLRGACVGNLRDTSDAVSAVVAYWDADGRFNLHEHLVTTDSTVRLTTNSIVFDSSAVSAFGMAAADYLGTGREVLFTGEPDGRIYSWTAVSNAPLKRAMFSGQYLGKAWSRMSACKDAEASEWLLGLSVDPTNTSRCSLIAWAPQSELWSPPDITQTEPRVTVLTSPNSGVERASVRIRVADSEGNATTPELQYQRPGETGWFAATLTGADGQPLAGTVTALSSVSTGVVHTLEWNCRANLGNRFVSNVLLRVRGRDVTLTGAWSDPVSYQVTVLPWYTVNVTAGANGSVEPCGAVSLMEGTATTLVARADAGYHVSGVRLDGVETNCAGLGSIAASLTVAEVTANHEVTFAFALDRHTFTVVSVHGSPEPAVGSHLYDLGSMISNRVDSQIEDGGTRYDCAGWRMARCEPVGGPSNQVTVVVTDDATLTWLWTTNYAMSFASVGPGTVSLTSGWYRAEQMLTLTAVPEQETVLAGWSGDTAGCVENGNSLTVPADQPRSITATFSRDMRLLVVASRHGMCDPADGQHPYPWSTPVTCAITNPVVFDLPGTARYTCTGWLGTGNVTNGMGTNTSFVLTAPSTVTWQWRTNYWLKVQVSGSGSVSATNAWYGDGENAILVASAGANYQFARWSGDTNGCVVAGTAIIAPMRTARRITAVFTANVHSLSVFSEHRRCLPDTGVHSKSYGQSVFCMVTNSPFVIGGTTQMVCTGWSGTGNVPASGLTTNTGTFTVTGDSAIFWQWRKAYLLTAIPSGQGELSVNSCWGAEGNVIVVQAMPQAYHTLFGWSGDIEGCPVNGTQLTAVMSRPRAIQALFVETRAPKGTPEAWLAAHGLTNAATSAAELLDADGDGFAAWQEYLADTDPTNLNSRLELTGMRLVPGGAEVGWQGGVMASQWLEARYDLGNTGEQWVAIFTNLPPTATATTVLDTGATNALRFYRIRAGR